MAKVSEQISKANTSSQGKTDANLANDSNHLGGIAADEYATKKYVKDYHDPKEEQLRADMIAKDNAVLAEAKEYTNAQIRNQDFSSFAKVTDVQALDTKLTGEITEGLTAQKNYTDSKTQAIVNDVNKNFQDVTSSINSLNGTVNNLFGSVSNGKSKIAGAITDKGVPTSASATYDTMAINIRAIPTGGGSGTDPNYVNTSDATATASDILNGKTAYVKGQKVYGNLIFTGENNYQINEDNPYPEKAEVELVYGEKENDLEVNTIGVLNVEDGGTALLWFDISCDRRILVRYDDTQKKIIIYKKQADGTYAQEKNQFGELRTPEYSLSDLGINTSNYQFAFLKLSIMNSDTNESGYDCRLAIIMDKVSNTSESTPLWICYVYRISTYDGTIKAENESFQAGIGENVKTYTKYNKWIIEGRSSTNSDLSKYEYGLYWSPYSNTLVIPYRRTCYIYQFSDSSLGEEDYSKAVHLRDSFGAQGDSFRDLKILNNDKLIKTYTDGNYTRYDHLRVYGNNFNFIKESTSSLDLITNDGLYGLLNGSIRPLTINYDTGDVSIGSSLGSTNIDFSYSDGGVEKFSFSRDNKFLFVGNDCYSVDFETLTFEKIYSVENGEKYKLLSDLKTKLVLPKDPDMNATYMIETVPDGQNLIGIKYQGNMYYSSLYRTNVLTAKQSDVRSGKTFVGYDGIPQTGTMEVSE